MDKMENVALMKPFNLTFFVVTAIFIAILVAASLIMKNKSDRAKRIVIASAAAVGNNDLNVSTGEKPTNAYVLAMNPTIGFYLWDSSVTLEEGKVYLQASSGARAFLPFGEATGIEATPNNEAKSNVVFDLQGRRVAKPAKGLYIIDGRKVMVK